MSDPRRRPGQQVQTVWGWKVAAYLFGAGMGSGAYALGAAAVLAPSLAGRGIAQLAMILGAAAVLLSVGFLVWDLGRPERFLRVLIKVRRSWLSRGSWILIAFCLVALISLWLGSPPALAAASLAFALAVAAYTGLLLGTMLSRSLWNSPLLPVLFLVSALSSGVAWLGVGGLAVAAGSPGLSSPLWETVARLRSTHAWLLVAELAVLYFYLAVAGGRSREGADLLLRGRLRWWFWVGVIALGLVVPLLVDALTAGAGSAVWGLVADLAVLVGAYLLRRVILLAGVRSPVHLGVPFVIRPEV